MFLQYYREYGAETRFVDLGLQTHRIKCRVHNDFKSVNIIYYSVLDMWFDIHVG